MAQAGATKLENGAFVIVVKALYHAGFGAFWHSLARYQPNGMD
jgi:hypothetical protein